MKTNLEFKVVAFDTMIIPTQKKTNTHSLFVDNSEYDGESITKKIEEKIVLWLFNQEPAKELVFSQLGIHRSALIKLQVKDPIIVNPSKKPGDIDVIFWEQNQPDRAIVIECKRVKVTAIDSGTDKINKIKSIKDGVIQANALHEFGFHKTYLAIIAEVDGRNRKGYNVLFRSSTPQTFSQIYDFPLRAKLHNDIGILFIEIVQPTGKEISNMAYVGICIDKQASLLEQPHHLTNLVKILFN